MAFWKLYYHLVWSTKNRQPFITAQIEPHLYAFLVSRAAEMNVFVYQVNGMQEHVHVVAAIPPKHAIATVVKNLKGASSHFINDRQWLDEHFVWQRGYGALSVGEKQRPFAERYVANQKQHHTQQTANSWLEYTTQFDEGPSEAKPKAEGLIRESGAVYQVNDDEFPF